MKKLYVTPEMEIVEAELATFLAASPDGGWKDENNFEDNPQAPGMVFIDDVDLDPSEIDE